MSTKTPARRPTWAVILLIPVAAALGTAAPVLRVAGGAS
jgi:hypothetical protein